ncbi:MAG: Uma2 family endonuclease [Planctomycetota bacterium]
MSALSAFQPRYTVADYLTWQGDWELWDGAAISMSPSPFGRHSALVARTITQLSKSIESGNCEGEVLTELDWIVSDSTVVRPDVIAVCGGPPAEHLQHAPAFIAEVLSEATRERDLNYK